MLVRRWRNISQRNVTKWANNNNPAQTPVQAFKFEFFLYHPQRGSNTRRRANPRRIAEARERLRNVHPEMGELVLNHTATRMARTQPDSEGNTPIPTLDDNTTRQMGYLDEMGARLRNENEEQRVARESEHCVVKVLLGNTWVPLQMNTLDLRRAVGNPPYRMFPTNGGGIFGQGFVHNHNVGGGEMPDTDHGAPAIDQPVAEQKEDEKEDEE